MKSIKNILFFLAFLALLDPIRIGEPTESGSNPDPDLIRFRNHNTAYEIVLKKISLYP